MTASHPLFKPFKFLANDYRDATTAFTSQNIQKSLEEPTPMVALNEKPYMNRRQMHDSIQKFSKNDFQHFKIMIKVQSP